MPLIQQFCNFLYLYVSQIHLFLKFYRGSAAVQEQNCNSDFVTIPDAFQNGVLTPGGDRFCGLGIDATTSSARPFVIYSVSNGNETPDIGNRGWYLTYTQNMCPV